MGCLAVGRMGSNSQLIGVDPGFGVSDKVENQPHKEKNGGHQYDDGHSMGGFSVDFWKAFRQVLVGEAKNAFLRQMTWRGASGTISEHLEFFIKQFKKELINS